MGFTWITWINYSGYSRASYSLYIPFIPPGTYPTTTRGARARQGTATGSSETWSLGMDEMIFFSYPQRWYKFHFFSVVFWII
jgi:hypothetical protein